MSNFKESLFIPKSGIDSPDKKSEEKKPSDNILDQHPENPFSTGMFRDAYDHLKKDRDSKNEKEGVN